MSFGRDFEYFIVSSQTGNVPGAVGNPANTEQSSTTLSDSIAPVGSTVILGGAVRIQGSSTLTIRSGDALVDYFTAMTPANINFGSGGLKLHHGIAALVGDASTVHKVYYRVLRAPLA